MAIDVGDAAQLISSVGTIAVGLISVLTYLRMGRVEIQTNHITTEIVKVTAREQFAAGEKSILNGQADLSAARDAGRKELLDEQSAVKKPSTSVI